METVTGYRSSLEHLLAELERLDVLLRAAVTRLRQRRPRVDKGLGGFVIGDDEIDALLDAGPPTGTERPEQSALDQLDTDIAVRSATALADGVFLRLPLLAGTFALAPIDLDIVLLCLAPEVDRRYERIYGYLQDDVTQRLPTVDLITSLLCASLDARLDTGRYRFGATSPLRRNRLVVLDDDPARPRGALLAKRVHLDPRVAAFLFGDDRMDDRLLPIATLVDPGRDLGELVLPAAVRATLERLASHPAGELALYLRGPYGVGKRSVAEACCRRWGAALLVVHRDALASRSGPDFDELLVLAAREARLQGAVLYWDGFDELLAESRRIELNQLLTAVEASPVPVFLAGNAAWEPIDRPGTTDVIRLDLPAPGIGERVELWRASLNQETVAGVDVEELAKVYRLTGGQIVDAVRTARASVRLRGSDEISGHDLAASARLQSSSRLAAVAERIEPRYDWDDLVLPVDQLNQLREIDGQVRHRSTIFERWGFGRLVGPNQGVNVLFAGPPGTGKTMAADVLAGSLGLELYRIDLSAVVSKYIGETEKNLSRVFTEAQAANAILFFDEADSLFGRRTAVGDAHDRYANLETSYLLQQLENHDSLVILATNLRANLDDAFVRRLAFVVDFPLPGIAERTRIWTGLWPAGASLGPDLDLAELARAVELPGGNIRNIALAASFRAAAENSEVTMTHLWQAARREYQKVGKVPAGGPLGTPAADSSGDGSADGRR